MGKHKKINEAYANNFGINLENCELLGEGNHGKVYRIAFDRVIKICRDSKSCILEAFILSRTNGSSHFPRIYDYDEHFIIRDYVAGEFLHKYVKRNGISRNIIVNLIDLIEEFKQMGFTKLDIRCRDIVVQANEHLMVIDPKASYTREVSYPRHLMKGLKKLGVLEVFLDVLQQERPDLYDEWNVDNNLENALKTPTQK